MNYDFKQSTFSKTLLTSVFVGFIATILCLIYNIIYRESTGFQLSDVINVSTLIFGVNLIFVVIGLVHFILLKNFKKGEIIFTALFVLLTLLGIWGAEAAHRTANVVQNHEFRQLLLGTVLIMGLAAAFLVPFLSHNRTFQEHVI
jgi:hypothetical protein